jgi:hypothetical protein
LSLLTRVAKALFVGGRVRQAITAAGLVCLAASVTGQDRPRPSLEIERAELHLFPQVYKALRGPRADFFFRLPEHVAFAEGSELRLGLDVSAKLLPHILQVRVMLNSEPLAEAAPIAEWCGVVQQKIFQAGWNRVSIELTEADSKGSDLWSEPAGWGLWRSNTFLTIAYKRMAPFPELARFPHSYTEQKLLGNSGTVAEIYLPEDRRDVYMRAIAILGARFGQIDYVQENEIRLRPISDWKATEDGPSGVLVARKDELAALPLSREVDSRLQGLSSGEGLLAEFFLGEQPRQRRCLLVTGADDSGLEKAMLTLGSAPALIWAPPSPFVISAPPDPRPDLAFLARPHSGSITFETLGWSRVLLHGPMREEILSGWRLPPGYMLGPNSRLHLNIVAAPGLTNSALDVLVNGKLIEQVALTPEFANLGTARIDLPERLRGHDPMTLTFRTRLFLNSASNSAPWVAILGTSHLEVRPRQMDTSTLEGLPSILFADPFLTKLAFAAPAEASWTELKSLFEVARQAGRNLPSSQILWPEAVAYSAEDPPSAKRLHGRNVVVLGSATQWASALSSKTKLPIAVGRSNAETVYMQGRRYDALRFEPELGIAQLIQSPWDADRTALVAGSWRTFDVPGIYKLFTDSEAADFLFGNIAMIDASGRGMAYDTRKANSESLTERIERELPRGLGAQETKVRRGIRDALAAESQNVNRNVWIFVLLLLGALVGARVWFTWDEQRQRKKALVSEKPLAI